MCGIYALFNPQQKINPRTLQQGIQTLHHRGPDAQSTQLYANQHLGFAHARLSLIDLSSNGNQPFETEKSSIIFNGEIYNYQDLKLELEQQGISFRSTSDTEVLLRAIETWGLQQTLPKLDGTYAALIFDKQTNQLTILRDYIGEKQLLYAQASNGDFIFASEAKAILQHPHFQKKPNLDHILEQLIMFAYTDSSQTAFQNIYTVPIASYLTISLDNPKIQQHRYWQPQSTTIKYRSKSDISFLIKTIREQFDQSVKRRIHADALVGTILSGGLDSSFLTAIAANILQQENRTLSSFTLGYQNANNKDIKNASRLVQDHQNIQHIQTILPDTTTTDLIQHTAYIMEEPLYDKSSVAMYLNYQAVHKQQIKAVLNGQASDELWLGYLLVDEIFSLPSNTYKPNNFISYWLESSPFWELFANKDIQEQTKSMVQKNIQTNYPDTDESPLNKLIQFSANTHLPQLLREEDLLSMANSVEVRLPFSAQSIITLALQIDARLKKYDKREKYLLRKAAQPLVPRSIITRKKMPLPHAPVSTDRNDARNISKEFVCNSQLVNTIFKSPGKNYTKYSLEEKWIIYSIALFEKLFFA